MQPKPSTLVIRFVRDHTHITEQGAAMPFTAPEFYAVDGALAETLVLQGIARLHDVQHEHNTLSAEEIEAFNEANFPKPPPPPDPEIELVAPQAAVLERLGDRHFEDDKSAEDDEKSQEQED